MRIPISWLKEHLDVPLTPEKISDTLTLSGTKIEGMESTPAGDVLIAEITGNRADCLSIRGIAVELAAALGKRPKKFPLHKIPSPKTKDLLSIRIKITDRKLCPAYTMRVFDSVSVQASPSGLAAKLGMMGQGSVNNVADITNFCLFEIGQPTHAFDYDKIRGKKIIVRNAVKGEKFWAINGNEYELDESIPVIADEERVIAIAGVMGGKETEITPATRRVAVESARFDPVRVREAARKLKISTASSYRFERGIDPTKVVLAQDRIADLLIRWARAKVASDLRIEGTVEPRPPKWISIDLVRASRFLHLPLSAKQAVRRLALLGIRSKAISESVIRCATNPSRPDLTIEEDFVEEIARLEGYDRVPLTLPAARFAAESLVGSGEYRLQRRIRHYLVAQGFWEAMTYSLVSDEALNCCGLSAMPRIKVKNGLTLEQANLKPSSLPGLLAALSFNARRKEKDVRLFEISRVFPGSGENTALSLLATGVWIQDWEQKQSVSFAKIKGVLENIWKLSGHKISGLSWRETDPGEALKSRFEVIAQGQSMGFMGEVSAATLARMDLVDRAMFVELDLDRLTALPPEEKIYCEIPKTPAVRRDLAILIHTKHKLIDIENVIKEASGAHLVGISLFDEYRGKGIPEAHRSLAFNLQLQKPDGTFKDEETLGIHHAIVEALKNRFGAQLR